MTLVLALTLPLIGASRCKLLLPTTAQRQGSVYTNEMCVTDLSVHSLPP